tara:strand:+ start:926 stop:1741 length:816 start_codon:yes stop_codon:yes gene_type:complete
MNNYFVIGNPIDHSLSPLIHNYWFKKYKINGTYEKRKLETKDLKNFIVEIKNNKNFKGANVTVPFKNKIIPFLDELSSVAEETFSVNTIVKENKKLIGHNTDATAFEKTLKENESWLLLKSLIIGAGGVTSSIIWAIRNLNRNKIYITNRTKEKATNLVNRLSTGLIGDEIEVLDWGEIPDVNLIVNTTSLGLNQNDDLKLDFKKYKNKKDCMFYDLIYNPKETIFLKDAKKRGNYISNGKMMFLLQAKQAFKLWTNVDAEIDKEILKIVD